MIRDSKDTFSVPDAPQRQFVFSIKAKDTTVDLVTPNRVYHVTKYIMDTLQPDEGLQTYTGTYYCPELDCNYGIILKDHHLFLTNSKYNDTRITVANNKHLLTDYWWIRHLNMLRDSKQNIIGFEINAGSIMHLRFNKMK